MGLMVGRQRETAAASGMEGREWRPLRGASPGLCLRLDAPEALGTYLAGLMGNVEPCRHAKHLPVTAMTWSESRSVQQLAP